MRHSGAGAGREEQGAGPGGPSCPGAICRTCLAYPRRSKVSRRGCPGSHESGSGTLAPSGCSSVEACAQPDACLEALDPGLPSRPFLIVGCCRHSTERARVCCGAEQETFPRGGCPAPVLASMPCVQAFAVDAFRGFVVFPCCPPSSEGARTLPSDGLPWVSGLSWRGRAAPEPGAVACTQRHTDPEAGTCHRLSWLP